MECKCYIDEESCEGAQLVKCPLCKLAPDLYEELKLTRGLLIDLSAYAPNYWANRAKTRIIDGGKALSKAGGK